MFKKKFSSIFIVAAAFIMTLSTSFSSLQSVSAAEDLENQIESILADYDETTEEVSEDVKEHYMNLAQSTIDNKEASIHAPAGVNLDYENANVREVNNNFYMVKLNYSDNSTLHEFSGVSLFFDADGNLVQYFELQMEQIDQNSGTVTAWSDGVKNLDEVVQTDENVNDGEIGTYSWSGFVDCLNNAGVSAWAVTALSVACGAICAGTAGAGCAPCLYAASSITGGTLGWCIGSNL